MTTWSAAARTTTSSRAAPAATSRHGDDGDDVVIGGSTFDHGTRRGRTVDRYGTGVADGDDTIRGDGGPDGAVGGDLLAGDNALPIRIGAFDFVVRPARLRDASCTTSPAGEPDGDGRRDDTLDGGGDADRVFGQGGDDAIIAGGGGDDYVEGNDGDDTIPAGMAHDDVVGGSSTTTACRSAAPAGGSSPSCRRRRTTGRPPALADGVDEIDGGAGEDVVLGDNGRITARLQPTPRRHIARADECGADRHTCPDVDEIGRAARRRPGLRPGRRRHDRRRVRHDHVEGNTAPTPHRRRRRGRHDRRLVAEPGRRRRTRLAADARSPTATT